MAPYDLIQHEISYHRVLDQVRHIHQSFDCLKQQPGHPHTCSSLSYLEHSNQGHPGNACAPACQVEGIRRMLFNGWGHVAGVERLGFIELEGKGTPVKFLANPAEVATACTVLQKVVITQDATRSCCWFTCWCTALLATHNASALQRNSSVRSVLEPLLCGPATAQAQAKCMQGAY